MSAAASQPKTVGRFQVINLLGKGGHGAVYFAHDPQLQRPVALKTVRLEKQSPEAIKALNEEARTISQLQHPNIVTLYDMVQEGGHQYMVLEYVEGQTLAQKIAGVMVVSGKPWISRGRFWMVWPTHMPKISCIAISNPPIS